MPREKSNKGNQDRMLIGFFFLPIFKILFEQVNLGSQKEIMIDLHSNEKKKMKLLKLLVKKLERKKKKIR